MSKKMKVVRNYGEKRERPKWLFPIILAILAVVTVLGIIIGIHLYDEYYTYQSSEARNYETVEAEQGKYVLLTERKELLGKVYAGFSIKEEESGEIIYECPDLYPVKELLSIEWKDGADSVLVTEKDGKVTEYIHDKEVWKKSED